MSNTSGPKASICIASFNHAHFLPETLDSALNQTYPNIEVVLVDDGSTDGSLEIAQSYASRFPDRFKVFTHPGHQNRGISATINLATEKATGDYWCAVGSDDIFYPDKVQSHVEFIEKHPEIGWVYSYADHIDDTGRLIPDRGLFGEDLLKHPDPLERLLQGNCIPGMTVTARRSCLDWGPIFEHDLVCSDWEFAVNLLARHKVAFLDRPSAKYRIHGSNTTGGRPKEVHYNWELEVMDALKRKASIIGGRLVGFRALLDLRLAYLYFRLGDTRKARGALTSVFDSDPSLRNDCERLNRWLHPEHMESDFRLWTLKNLPSFLEKPFIKNLAASQYAKEAYTDFHAGNSSRARKMALRSLLSAPSNVNQKSLLYILIKSLIPSRTAND